MRRYDGSHLREPLAVIHLSTVRLLREWARWGEAHNIDYPSMSPMFGERALKSPLYGIGYVPDEVMRIEQAVCALCWEYREMIIQHYHRKLNFKKLGEWIGRDWRTARDRLKAAEHEVHQNFGGKFTKSAVCGKVSYDLGSISVSLTWTD